MPFYNVLKKEKPEDVRTIEGLLRLHGALNQAIPEKTLDQTLILGSWNLREFGGTKHGGREQEPLFYIAEILSRFDLIAVQEVRDNLDALDKLIEILGRNYWKYLVSDVTLGPKGNSERHAYVYDTRKISFGGLVGELSPPAEAGDGELVSKAFSRSPFLAGFRAGWFKFTIATQHMYYGDSKPDDPVRVSDAKLLVQCMKARMKQKDRWANNAILLGDFNVFTTNDKTFQLLIENDFDVPDNLEGKYTNAKLDKPFDQMAFLAPSVAKQMQVAKAGVFPFFDYVYRADDLETYQPGATTRKYNDWRTYKMSDHLPIWVELTIDFSEDYLNGKLK